MLLFEGTWGSEDTAADRGAEGWMCSRASYFILQDTAAYEFFQKRMSLREVLHQHLKQTLNLWLDTLDDLKTGILIINICFFEPVLEM